MKYDESLAKQVYDAFSLAGVCQPADEVCRFIASLEKHRGIDVLACLEVWLQHEVRAGSSNTAESLG